MSANFRTSTGEPITFTLEGIEEVQNELNQISEDLRAKASLEMVTQVGDLALYYMRQNVLRNGLLKSGALFRSIYATVMTNDEGAEVYVGPNTEKIPYAMIHEYGGIIPAHWVAPKTKKALHWETDGTDFFSKGHMVGIKKQIIIKERPYIAPAFDDHQEEILEKMTEIFNEYLAEDVVRYTQW